MPGAQLSRVAQARLTHVDADDARAWVAQGVPRRLRGATAGDEYVEVFSVGAQRPGQVIFGAPSSAVGPALLFTLEVASMAAT